MSEEKRIVTHEMLSLAEREKRPQGLLEHATWKNRPSYMQRRTWTQTKDDSAKRFGRFHFHCPDWLMPKNGVHRFCTFSASIVWGLAGKQCQDVDDDTETFAICL